MAQRPHAIPKIKCSRTARRTGKKCELWAVPGTVLCWVHGSGGRPGDEGGRTAGGRPRGGPSPQRRRAKTRLVLAELMSANPRHPWEVVLNAVHIADSVMREAELPLRRGEQLEVGQLDRLLEYTKYAHQLAKTALDVNAHEKIAESFRRDVDLEGGIVAEVLGAVLDALLAGLAGPALPPERAERLRAWAFGAARDALAALEDPTRPTVSVPPPPLDGLALVLTDRPQLEPAASSASSESSSAARRRPAAGRQPTPAADTATAQPAPASGRPAPTRWTDDDEPLDAELVYDDEPRPVFGRVGYRATSAEHREELATRLRAVRLTRVQLAELTGLGDHAVWRALNGRVHEDELPTWDRLLTDLDVADLESSAGPEPEPRDPIARGWEDAGREDHPLSERLNRAAERSWSRDAT